jgi:PAS domain S-box-containing protein
MASDAVIPDGKTARLSGFAAEETVNILLVDDEPRNLDVLESILNLPVYRLVRAQTPEEALIALVHQDFACIVLDIRIPGMSGLELARLIKTRRRCQHVPIIFLTAFFQEEKDILQGYDVGAVDYLTKPVNPQILKSKVDVFVELFRTTRALKTANAALELEITHRQEAEEALRQSNTELETRVNERTRELTLANRNLTASERRYREMVHALPAALYTCDVQGRIVLYNEAAVALWGRKPEAGQDSWCGSCRIYRPDGTPLPLDQSPMAITLKEGRTVRGEEIVIERPDGSRRCVLPYPEPIRNDSGEIVGAMNMLVDLTGHKEAEKARAHLAAIIESSGDAIISKDLNGLIQTWNHGAELIFGYSAAEAVGSPIALLVPPERQAEENQIMDTLRQGKRIEHFETVRVRKDGSRIDVSLAISPVKDTQGRIVGASNITRDITRQKRAEQALERAHQEVLAASRAKDDFLAALSHELRTPLNPVLLLASEAAHDPYLPPPLREKFDLISKNVSLEARLIDDLLDLTRITRGKLNLEVAPVNAHLVLQDALAVIQPEIEQKQIFLKVDLGAERHLIRGDAIRLQQVFWNVLKNAVKFTPETGRITIATRTLRDRGELSVEITDTGIGMAVADLNRIFEPFSQGVHTDKGGSHRFGGLGLGLAISRKLIELHSGRIRASSPGRDRGATFYIELPLAENEAVQNSFREPVTQQGAPAGSDPTAPAAAVRILLVEDHEPTRTALAQLLRRRRYEVVTAASLKEARTHATRDTFHLLISDIGLPDGSGNDLMTELRKGNGLRGIALTGYGMEQDIAGTRSAGFDAHLIKPIRVESLEEALASVLNPENRPAPS